YSTTSTGGQTGPYCDYGTPCTNPGDYCDANQCLPIPCYSDNDCPYDSVCLSDGYCSGVPCGGNYGSTIVCPENFACTYGFCREAAAPPQTTGGCQCGVVGGGARGAWAAPALLGLLVLRFVRRRRRA
ncbi:MAG: hypothetical protein HY905_16775, partial [Deltaproteobacteria bacterium]|nr:hypothetical protein [Deltaproteobacteria bacterium]